MQLYFKKDVIITNQLMNYYIKCRMAINCFIVHT